MNPAPHNKLPYRVETYNNCYRKAFVTLNFEWIQKYFVVEKHDLEQLNNPDDILQNGGEIFFVIEGGRDGLADQVVGTCAMILLPPTASPTGTKSSRGYELAKMAVSPNCRGKGYGDVLMRAAVEWARSQGAGYVMLLSNTKLEPAINLYKKHGFAVARLGSHPDYDRCNIEMILSLTDDAAVASMN